MKLKCPSCGKRKAQYMSKTEIRALQSSFIDATTFNKVITIIESLYSPKYLVCTACGYVKEDS